jgi:hypothetical protein
MRQMSAHSPPPKLRIEVGFKLLALRTGATITCYF